MEHPDKRQEYVLIEYKGGVAVLAKRDFNPDIHQLFSEIAPPASEALVPIETPASPAVDEAAIKPVVSAKKGSKT